jgi:membrane protein implicated in regulation of membrane protease activity
MLIRWLANHPNPRVVAGMGVALAGAAVAIAALGIATHQPIVTRISLFLIVAGVALFVMRRRRNRNDQDGPKDP